MFKDSFQYSKPTNTLKHQFNIICNSINAVMKSCCSCVRLFYHLLLSSSSQTHVMMSHGSQCHAN